MDGAILRLLPLQAPYSGTLGPMLAARHEHEAERADPGAWIETGACMHIPAQSGICTGHGHSTRKPAFGGGVTTCHDSSAAPKLGPVPVWLAAYAGTCC